MQKCGWIRNACARACTECQREMGGGGGHLMGAPTNRKDGLWGQWWAKLPRVLEWQGWTGGAEKRAKWAGGGGGTIAPRKKLPGGVGGGGGGANRWAASPKKRRWGGGWSGGRPRVWW